MYNIISSRRQFALIFKRRLHHSIVQHNKKCTKCGKQTPPSTLMHHIPQITFLEMSLSSNTKLHSNKKSRTNDGVQYNMETFALTSHLASHKNWQGRPNSNRISFELPNNNSEQKEQTLVKAREERNKKRLAHLKWKRYLTSPMKALGWTTALGWINLGFVVKLEA